MRVARRISWVVLNVIVGYALVMGAWSTAVKMIALSGTRNVTYETSGWRTVERFEAPEWAQVLMFCLAPAALAVLTATRVERAVRTPQANAEPAGPQVSSREDPGEGS